MEEPADGSLDGSSIKPVSSLRSHFEQMASSKPSNLSGAKALSPQPTGGSVASGGRDIIRPGSVRLDGGLFGEALKARGRETEIHESALRPPRTASANPPSPSPTRPPRPRPLSTLPPAVTIQPPQSPPKSKGSVLTLSSTPAYLSTDAPLSASSGGSSPRHFRIPSRPNTPHLEPGKSPKQSSSQPPSPPPPRRSGEFRREAAKVPPPINRSEKPKIASKPMALAFRTEATTLDPGRSNKPDKETSPFNTPPSSSSSPESELPPPSMPRRPYSIIESSGPSTRTFEPPPIHHSVVSRRKDQETNGLNRGLMSPQVTGDERPALPTRPQAASENVKARAPSGVMMPPPPRPSVDTSRARPSVTTAESTPTFATPPKRVFSTPTSQQLQTPPRSHGRSMTVDRTSDRVPAEFRTVPTPVAYSDPRQSLDVAAPSTAQKDPLPLGDYPDVSHSNRRPPYFKQGAREISTKYDTRILDVCGEYVCTTGHFTRVWSLVDGELIVSLSHGENIKIVSVAFKSASEIKDEGARLWLGNNIGELMEVDVLTASVVTSKTNAHTRREIIKIYRHTNEMWTLDDGGTLHLWAPDSTGSPALTNPYQSFRVPKGHTFSMVVGDELWHAAGKDLRVFIPTLDGSTQFQVLQRPLNQSNAGDITSGTTISSQPDRVYFGHTDGKVSIYSRRDYACLGIVNVSIYKITTLAGIDGNLWAGFSTGMVYVYDTTQTPWVTKKDWQAHHDPVVKLIPDRSSCWTLDRVQAVSLGQDNMIRVWDGLLQDDWIENEMQSQEASFCELQSIKALVMTWNAGATTPYHLQHSDQDAAFFKSLIQESDCPDVIVFGFQELVDLEDKKTVTKSFFKSSKKKDPSEMEHMSHQYRDWRDHLTRCLDEFMPRDEIYHLLHTAHLVGLFSCIFVRAPLRDRIRSVSAVEVKRGMNGLTGNKGAIVIRFVLDDSSLCFINCHLAAGQTQTKDRNADISSILEGSVLPVERDHSVRQDSYIGGGDGSMIMDHEICILNGDLNYRIDTMGRDTVVRDIKARNYSKLLDRDQLLASKRKNPWFRLRSFQELPITFAPTYKYDVGTDNYDTSEKKRAPAWCDRILYRGRDRIQQLNYRRHEVRVSDHRPVTGTFKIVIKKISPKKRAARWDECQRRLQQRKERLLQDAKADYLNNVLGVDTATIKQLTLKHKADG